MTGCHKALAVLPVTISVCVFCHQGFVSQSTLKMMSQQLFVWCFCNPFCKGPPVLHCQPFPADSKAYLQVFRRLLDEPLPSKPADQKIPIWETLGTSWGEAVVDSHRCGMVICVGWSLIGPSYGICSPG